MQAQTVFAAEMDYLADTKAPGTERVQPGNLFNSICFSDGLRTLDGLQRQSDQHQSSGVGSDWVCVLRFLIAFQHEEKTGVKHGQCEPFYLYARPIVVTAAARLVIKNEKGCSK